MRIASLNVQNMRLLKTGKVEKLHGAWDSDAPEDERFDKIDRRLTAELLKKVDADVIALQEVFDLETLDYFHDNFLLPSGAAPYPQRICLPGNDGRGLNVALLSRRDVNEVRSHAETTLSDLGIEPPRGVKAGRPIFRRDCLMVTIGPLSLFLCHFKSAYPDEAKAWTIRNLEAQAARRVIERRFEDPAKALWLILGDLNEPDGSERSARAIAPLESGFSVDLLERLPAEQRWTYYDPHSGLYHCPDVALASHALAERWPHAQPAIMRMGLGQETSRYHGSRLGGVGEHRPHASDHAAVVIDLQGL